jgi:hypothetical protein
MNTLDKLQRYAESKVAKRLPDSGDIVFLVSIADPHGDLGQGMLQQWHHGRLVGKPATNPHPSTIPGFRDTWKASNNYTKWAIQQGRCYLCFPTKDHSPVVAWHTARDAQKPKPRSHLGGTCIPSYPQQLWRVGCGQRWWMEEISLDQAVGRLPCGELVAQIWTASPGGGTSCETLNQGKR